MKKKQMTWKLKNKRHVSESHLVKEISKGNEKAYEELFFKYYYQLCRFAVKITKCNELARDTVQEVFFKIWVTRENWDVHQSLSAYLYQAVRYHALNMMEHQGVRNKLSIRLKEEPDLQPSYSVQGNDHSVIDSSQLVTRIWELVEEMPEQRKLVFELHRKNGLSYREISQVMGIARKTVENHMGRALRELREKLV